MAACSAKDTLGWYPFFMNLLHQPQTIFQYPGRKNSNKNVLLACIAVSALFVVYVAAQGSIDVVVIGNLSKVQHRVSGSVST